MTNKSECAAFKRSTVDVVRSQIEVLLRNGFLYNSPVIHLLECYAQLIADQEKAEPFGWVNFIREFSVLKRNSDDRPVYLHPVPSTDRVASQGGDVVLRESPLGDQRWHHGNGVLVCGTFRIARADWEHEVCSAGNLREEMFDWMCERLSLRSNEDLRATPADGG